MDKYFLIVRFEYEGLMMITDEETIIYEFEDRKSYDDKLLEVKNKGWKIIKSIKGREF